MKVGKIIFNLVVILLLCAGIAMVGIGINNKSKTQKAQNEYKKAFDKSVDEGKVQDESIICMLEIPKINLSVVVREGTEDGTLAYAVGHFEDTAMPGEKGNFAVAGHRNYTTGEFFLKINELVKGDEIKVTTYENNYTYTVTDSETVAPNNMDVLKETEGATITLVTCNDDGSERLIVRGNLK